MENLALMDRQFEAAALELSGISDYFPAEWVNQYGTQSVSQPESAQQGSEIYACHSGNCCPQVLEDAGKIALTETAKPGPRVTMSHQIWGQMVTRFAEVA